ncbi:hypothetical protein BTVI_136673 [Pitangus sulphuratus]|nr:hypothetical protein BTVI_136673 [Pitangus sulphuratus]
MLGVAAAAAAAGMNCNRLILYFGLMPRFSVADQSYQERGLIDKGTAEEEAGQNGRDNVFPLAMEILGLGLDEALDSPDEMITVTGTMGRLKVDEH